MLKEIDFLAGLVAVAIVVTVYMLELSKFMSSYVYGDCSIVMVVGKDYRLSHFNGIFPIYEDVIITKRGKDEWVYAPTSYMEQNFIQSLDDDFSGWIRVCSGRLYHQDRFKHLY